MTTLKEICKTLGIETKAARRTLRKKNGAQKKRYLFETKKEVEAVKKLLAA